ncbi:hypothetical protein BIW11_03019 [Tropilaelaps mercedesae]|uniref:C2H2-type domain-containing protein n=1 Tax=Tropilaelaps mercedesae TaxID=418985 RepID=A0A1V9XTI2_9ACAR|nr:hypothetical protein BIW11_03019 [Tropilaelaps mercedesae]
MEMSGKNHDRGQRPYHNSQRGLRPMRTPERGSRVGLSGGGPHNAYDHFGSHGMSSRPPGPYPPHMRHAQSPHGPIGMGLDHNSGPGNRSMMPPPSRDNARGPPPRSREEIEALFSEHRIVALDRPSPMFPNAKWFCRLCHQHFNQMSVGEEHCQSNIHRKKKAALDLRKIVLALPRKPEPRHATALETELQRVFTKYRITKENLDKRKQLVNELDAYLTESLKGSSLRSIVDERWLKIQLNLQGSSLSGMGLSGSDVNVDLHLPKSAPTDVQAKVFFEILHILEKWSCLQKVEPHFNQKVPKIKAVHCATNLPLELGLSGTLALKTNRLLADYASLDNRVLPLAVCLRYWASKCRLDDPTFGTLPPHSFPILTIYYLQQCSPPVVPCIHEACSSAAGTTPASAPALDPTTAATSADETANGSVPAEEEEYVRPAKLNDWKSENTASLAELWVGMLRFYSAEFKMRKLCVSLLSRKKILLSSRRWPSRYIGIEDPFCKKKSLSRSMISDQVMTYFLMCLRSSALYFA